MKRLLPMLATLAMFGLMLTACQGAEDAVPGAAATGAATTDAATAGEGPSDDAEVDERTEVRIGYLPILNTATLVHADESGLFEEAGLDVELVATTGGAQAIPSLLAGELDVTYGNIASAIIAAQQGLPIEIVTVADIAADDLSVIVTQDSPIESFADLEGATVAVNTVQNIGELGIKTQIEDAGADPNAVNLAEIAFPDMIPALERGDVDAIWVVEPFQAAALAAGHRKLGDIYAGSSADMPVTVWMTTTEFAEDNADTIKSVREVLTDSARELDGNRDRFVELIPTYTQVPAEVVEQVVLPTFGEGLHEDKLQEFADLMLKYGFIQEPFDVSSMLLR